MRFLLLNYEFPPLGGGASSASFHMAKELAKQGHDVEVLTSGAPGLPSEGTVDGIRVHRVRSLRRGTHDAGLVGAATFLISAAWRLRLLSRSRFDFAHFFFSLPTGALAPLWVRWTDKPYIVSLRGSDVPGYDGGKKLALLHRLLQGVSRQILSDATRVVANSISLRDLARQSFPMIPIDVITNGVCTTTFQPRNAERSNQPLRVLCVARLVSRKGLEELIRAMAHPVLPACRLKIVGEGPLQSRLQALARTLEVTDRIDFAGWLHGEALARAYRGSDCFVLPSLAESFSMSLLEAMASGLPVVAARTGGIPELVEDGINGRLVTPGDAADLAAGLAWILNSEGRRRRIGRENRAKVCRRFAWARVVEAYQQRCYLPALAEEDASSANAR